MFLGDLLKTLAPRMLNRAVLYSALVLFTWRCEFCHGTRKWGSVLCVLVWLKNLSFGKR